MLGKLQDPDGATRAGAALCHFFFFMNHLFHGRAQLPVACEHIQEPVGAMAVGVFDAGHVSVLS